MELAMQIIGNIETVRINTIQDLKDRHSQSLQHKLKNI